MYHFSLIIHYTSLEFQLLGYVDGDHITFCDNSNDTTKHFIGINTISYINYQDYKPVIVRI